MLIYMKMHIQKLSQILTFALQDDFSLSGSRLLTAQCAYDTEPDGKHHLINSRLDTNIGMHPLCIPLRDVQSAVWCLQCLLAKLKCPISYCPEACSWLMVLCKKCTAAEVLCADNSSMDCLSVRSSSSHLPHGNVQSLTAIRMQRRRGYQADAHAYGQHDYML